MFSRNIKHIRAEAPAFLNSLGFEVLGEDWYGLGIRGGTISFLIKEKSNPNILYMCWVKSWFGKLQLDCIEPISPVNISATVSGS